MPKPTENTHTNRVSRSRRVTAIRRSEELLLRRLAELVLEATAHIVTEDATAYGACHDAFMAWTSGMLVFDEMSDPEDLPKEGGPDAA